MPLSKEDAVERHRYAAELAKLEELHELEFSQDSDGVFRAVVPREPPLQLRLVRPKVRASPSEGRRDTVKNQCPRALTLASTRSDFAPSHLQALRAEAQEEGGAKPCRAALHDLRD